MLPFIISANFPDMKMVGKIIRGVKAETGKELQPQHTDLLQMADNALYQAKDEGRNKICISGESTE